MCRSCHALGRSAFRLLWCIFMGSRKHVLDSFPLPGVMMPLGDFFRLPPSAMEIFSGHVMKSRVVPM